MRYRWCCWQGRAVSPAKAPKGVDRAIVAAAVAAAGVDPARAGSSRARRRSSTCLPRPRPRRGTLGSAELLLPRRVASAGAASASQNSGNELDRVHCGEPAPSTVGRFGVLRVYVGVSKSASARESPGIYKPSRLTRIPRVVDDLVDRRLWFFSLGLRLSIVITRLCGLALPRLRGRRAARLGAAALHRRSRNRRRFRRHPIGTLPTRLPRLKHVPPPFLHALRLPLHLLHERLPRRPNLEVAPTLDAIQLGQQPRQPFFVPMNGGVGRVVFELGCVQGGSRLEDELGGGRRGELSLEVLKPGGEFVEFLQPLRALVDDGFLLFLLLGLIFLCSLAWWLGLLLLVRSRRR